MTPSELKARHLAAFPDSRFFTAENMRFAGDTMANFRVAPDPVTFRRWNGDMVTAWELQRKRPVNEGLQSSHYFNVETFARVVRPDDPAGAEANHIWRGWTDDQRRDYCQWTFGARLTLPELAALGVDMSASPRAQ